MTLFGEKKKVYDREWISNRRKEFMSDKSCLKCDSKDKLVLHHREPSKKVSSHVWSWSEDLRDLELEKCDILCEQCHKEVHAAKCGTEQKYRNRCRCLLCREAHAIHNFEWRKRKLLREFN